MTTALFAVLVLLMSGAMAAAFEPPGEGPWRGTIVDADTKQPLEGVVVLAVWNERYGSIGGDAGGGEFGPGGGGSGPGGKVTVRGPERTVHPVTNIQSPDLFVFHTRYGRWDIPGGE